MPTASTLRFPPGYGRATRTIPWADVQGRLEAATAYWLSTVRPDGRPHVVPLDGIWVDDVWWYGGAPDTVHIRTVESNPHASCTCRSRTRRSSSRAWSGARRRRHELALRMAAAANEKYAHYGARNDAATYASALGLFPTRVLAWSAFPSDATRFDFQL